MENENMSKPRHSMSLEDITHLAILSYLDETSRKDYIKNHKEDIDQEEFKLVEPGRLINLIPYLDDLKSRGSEPYTICRIKPKLRRLKSSVLTKYLERSYGLIYKDQIEFWGTNGPQDHNIHETELSNLMEIHDTNQMNKGVIGLWNLQTTGTSVDTSGLSNSATCTSIKDQAENRAGKKRDRSLREIKDGTPKRQKGMCLYMPIHQR